MATGTSIGNITGTITLGDDFTKTFDLAITKIETGAKKIERAGQKVAQVGQSLVRNVTLPLTALGVGSVAAFGKFDAAMTKSLAIMGDVSDEMEGEMADAARKMAKEIRFTAEQSAESYFFLASAGLDAAASIEALPVVGKFAQAGLFDMARATDLLTDAQSALGLTIRDDAVANMENMVRISDILVKANTLANASVEQFATSLITKAATSMRQLNIDTESGVAVLAAWADQGVKAELAGERFNIVTRDLQTAAIKNRDAFDEMNISVFDSEGNFRNLADIIEDLENALEGMSAEQQKVTLGQLGFTDRSVQATQSLIGLSNQIRFFESEFRSATGTTDEVANKQLQGLLEKLGLLKDRLMDSVITLGQSLVPVLEDATPVIESFLEKIDNLAKGFADLPPEVKKFVVVIGGVVAATGPVLVALGGLLSMIGLIGQGAPVAAAGIKAIGAAIAAHPLIFAGGVAILAVSAPVIDTWIRLRKEIQDTERAMSEIVRSTNEFGGVYQKLLEGIKNNSLSAQFRKDAEVFQVLLAQGIQADAKRIQEINRVLEKARSRGIKDRITIELEKERDALQEGVDARLKQAAILTKMLVKTEAITEELETQSNTPPPKPPNVRLSDEYLAALEGISEQLEKQELLTKAAAKSAKDLEILEIIFSAGVPAAEALNKEIQLLASQLREEELRTARAERQRELILNVDIEKLLKGEESLKEILSTQEAIEEALKPVVTLRDKELEATRKTLKLLEDKKEKALQRQVKLWDSIANIVNRALSGMESKLARVVDLSFQMAAAFKQIKSASTKIDKALAQSSFGAAAGGFADTLLGGQFGSTFGAIGGFVTGIAGVSGPVGAAITGGLALLGGAIKKGADEGIAEFTFAAGEAVSTIVRDEAGLGQVTGQLVNTIENTLEAFFDQLGAEIAALESFEVKFREGLFTVNFFEQGIRKQFRSEAQAVSFILLQLIESGEFLGLSPEVKAAIASRTAKTFDELEKQVALATELADIDLSPLEIRLRDGIQEAFKKFEEAFEIGLPDPGRFLTSAVGSLEEAFNKFRGIEEDRRSQLEAEAAALSAAKQALLAKLIAQEAELQALVARIHVQAALSQADLTVLQTTQETIRGLHGLSQSIGQVGIASLQSLAATEAAIKGVQEAIAKIEALADITDEDIDARLARERRGRGRGRRRRRSPEEVASELERIEGQIDSFIREGIVQTLFGLEQQATGTAASLDRMLQAGEITQETYDRLSESLEKNSKIASQRAADLSAQSLFGDLLNFLGKSEEAARFSFEMQKAELLIRRAQLEIAQKEFGLEIALLDKIDQLILDVGSLSFEEFDALSRVGGDSFSSILEDLDKLEGGIGFGELFSDLGALDDELGSLGERLLNLHQAGKLSTSELIFLTDRLNEVGLAARSATVLGSAQGFLLELLELTGREEEAAQLRFNIALAELEIKRAELALALDTLELTEAAALTVGSILERSEALLSEVQQAGPGIFSRGRTSTNRGTGSRSGSDDRQRALDLLNRKREEALGQFVSQVRSSNAEFGFLRQTLGDTTEIYKIQIEAINDSISQLNRGVESLLESLELDTTFRTPFEQVNFLFERAQKELEEALASPLDLEERQQAESALQDLLAAGRGTFAGTSSRLRDLEDFIRLSAEALRDSVSAQDLIDLGESPLGPGARDQQDESSRIVMAIDGLRVSRNTNEDSNTEKLLHPLTDIRSATEGIPIVIDRISSDDLPQNSVSFSAMDSLGVVSRDILEELRGLRRDLADRPVLSAVR